MVYFWGKAALCSRAWQTMACRSKLVPWLFVYPLNYDLDVKHPPQPHELDHFFSSSCCFQRLWDLQGMESNWKKYVARVWILRYRFLPDHLNSSSASAHFSSFSLLFLAFSPPGTLRYRSSQGLRHARKTITELQSHPRMESLISILNYLTF